MINKTKDDELRYLEWIRSKLSAVLDDIASDVSRYGKEIQEQKDYLWEHKASMDHIEKVSVRQAVTNAVLTAEKAQSQRHRIAKLLASPYFGRFDFIAEGARDAQPVYIGVHAHYDAKENQSLIHDWRAPISTMFYDFETGVSRYDSPAGRVTGELVLKRQYRIRNGKMEFMLESSMNIHDEVLQKELSVTSDDKMKTIVATIQRDQNAIIRNEHSPVLIIQGVAGSGKTSIALHRIAFLLYRFKEDIQAKDVLIISPNRVFADYISNVLPELGEEMIPEMGMESLAEEWLDYQFKFQTFFEQGALLLEKNDGAFKKRIQAKASTGFLRKLDEYIAHMENTNFTPVDFSVAGRPVPQWFIQERYKAYRRLPILKRLSEVARDIADNIQVYYNHTVKAKERAEIKSALKKMSKLSGLRAVYRDFYTWLGQPHLYVQSAALEYSDVFPLIYLKMWVEGLRSIHQHVKHLLVDEMQDYTPVQYAVIHKVFTCKKTILGDANQSVNPFSSSSAEEIQKVFSDADVVRLNTSYRSTCEITNFSKRIAPNAAAVAIERHGEEPGILGFEKNEDEIQEIENQIRLFLKSGQSSLGIIGKTQKLADQLYQKMGKKHGAHLLTSRSISFTHGIIFCAAHMAKGLEFDQVIVPHVSDTHYTTLMDQSLLYVACTRAMHRLTLTYSGQITALIQ